MSEVSKNLNFPLFVLWMQTNLLRGSQSHSISRTHQDLTHPAAIKFAFGIRGRITHISSRKSKCNPNIGLYTGSQYVIAGIMSWLALRHILLTSCIQILFVCISGKFLQKSCSMSSSHLSLRLCCNIKKDGNNKVHSKMEWTHQIPLRSFS